MVKLLATAIFFAGFQSLLYYYLWRRLIRDTELASPWRRRATVLLIALGLGTVFTMMATRLVSAVIGQTLGWPFFIWLALALLLVVLFAFVDLGRLLLRQARRVARDQKASGPPDPGRRIFMNRALTGGVTASAVGLVGHGTVQALKTPEVIDVPIALRRFPAALNGFKLIQLSDIHVGNTIGRGFVQDLVDRTNAAKPDLIVITGDLVDGSVDDLANEVAPFAELRAPHGVFFVTGNHEYYAGVEPWLEHIEGELGIRVLRNERISIGGDNGFDLVGVDDHDAYEWPDHGADLQKAVHQRDTSRELIVLAHQPRQIDDSVKYGAGLQLSGHTHGGQIWPWHYLAMAQQGGLLAGLSRHEDTQLYISRGTGYWGPPVRTFAPAEITRVILRRET